MCRWSGRHCTGHRGIKCDRTGHYITRGALMNPSSLKGAFFRTSSCESEGSTSSSRSTLKSSLLILPSPFHGIERVKIVEDCIELVGKRPQFIRIDADVGKFCDMLYIVFSDHGPPCLSGLCNLVRTFYNLFFGQAAAVPSRPRSRTAWLSSRTRQIPQGYGALPPSGAGFSAALPAPSHQQGSRAQRAQPGNPGTAWRGRCRAARQPTGRGPPAVRARRNRVQGPLRA